MNDYKYLVSSPEVKRLERKDMMINIALGVLGFFIGFSCTYLIFVGFACTYSFFTSSDCTYVFTIAWLG